VKQTNAELAAALERAEGHLRLRTLRLEQACHDRDRTYQRLASACAEKASYKHQRDELVEALADLLLACDGVKIQGRPSVDDPMTVEFVWSLGDPEAVARDLVARYRRYVVPADAHETR
jgi:hypothetical protein